MTDAPSPPTIAVDAVSKWFGGVVAVSDVSLAVEPGVTALLGPNGAGKTTLLRTIAGLTAPSQGQVASSASPSAERAHVPPDRLHAGARVGVRLPDRARVRRAERAAPGRGRSARGGHGGNRTVALTEAENRKLRGYSRGMRQRTRLAATLVHDPELLLLDEPLSGTDPVQRLHLGNVIGRLGEEGRTILVSSHILEEVELLADRIHLMVGGKLAASGDFRAIRQQLNDRPFVVRIDTTDARALAAGLLEAGAVESVEIDAEGRLRVRSRDVSHLQRSVPAVAQRLGTRLLRVEPLDDSLESVFEYLAQG